MPSQSDTRRVHARLICENGETLEIVRYERAGKWYSEADGRKLHQLNVVAAAKLARHLQDESGGSMFLGLPGGATFDRIVREEA